MLDFPRWGPGGENQRRLQKATEAAKTNSFALSGFRIHPGVEIGGGYPHMASASLLTMEQG